MKKIVFLTAVVTGCVALAANTWYVDAENGNDDWNGMADFANANPNDKVGPKKTLGVFTPLVDNGDTIYVAPGCYTNGVSPTSANCRFYTAKGGISLISTGCATNTFICGEPDKTVAQDASPYGCGPNAILPIKMLGSGNTIKGITIANGRQTEYGNSKYGGGVVFEYYSEYNSLIDCVITNCVAVRGGGVLGKFHALRCRFTGNFATEGSHAMYLITAVNCIFENTAGYAVYNNTDTATFLNCLCRGNATGNFRAGVVMNVYNSVFLLGGTLNSARNKKCYFYNCYFDYDTSKVSTDEVVAGKDGDCRTFATGAFRFTEEGLPMRRNPVIDAGKSMHYNNNEIFPDWLAELGKDKDCIGNERVAGDAMDIGPVEHIADNVYANEWYVDERNGNDSNSGKTPELAKKTLVAIMEDRVPGDVVYAAPGVYSNNTIEVNSQKFRVKIPQGVYLVGAEGAEKPTILGESSANPDSEYGTGSGAVSCVYMSETDVNTSAGLYGFTLSGGHSFKASGAYGSAVRGSNIKAGIVADCVITNCVAGRGPVYNVGGVVRCRFLYNVSTEGAGGAVFNVNCVCDSYFKNSLSGWSKKYFHDVYHNANPGPSNGFVLNCTFDSDGNGGPHASGTGRLYAYNSMVRTASDEGGAVYNNCVVTTSPSTQSPQSYIDEKAPTVVTNRSAVALTEESHRPVAGYNPAVGKGNYVYYTNLAPFAVSRIIGKDLWGNPRLVNGVLDIGAVSCDRVAVKVSDSSTGLDVVGLEKDGLWHDAEENAEFTLSRNYTSPKLLRGAYVNGTYVDFNAHEDGWNYVGAMPSAGTVEIVPDYATVNDWYVDANLGNDANDGLRPGKEHAFKTLARASTNSLMEAGATVYVAEGVYNTGVVPSSIHGVDSTDSRLMVPVGIRFVASGDRNETVIEGASSGDTVCGIGNGAVRCCRVRGGSVQGFTMRNGNVNASSSSNENDQGGGIRFTSGDSFAYDCEIYNCNAVRGGGAASGANDQMRARLVRCYLHDNTVNTEGVEPVCVGEGRGAYRCSGYNTVVDGDCYVGKTWLNCTITGRCWGNGTTFYNCFIGADGASGAGVAATFTNCVTSGTFKDHSPHAGCAENKTYTFNRNKNWRPRSKDSALFNTGDDSLYAAHFPEDLAQFANLDFAGGERVLEGCIDVGAGEMIYDPTGTQIILR